MIDASMKPPTLGALVLFAMADGKTIRPAIIVHILPGEPHVSTGTVNLRIFTDGTNDVVNGLLTPEDTVYGTPWRTLVPFGAIVGGDPPPNSWHWPAA